MRKFFVNSSLGIWVKVLLIKLKNARKKVKIGRGCNIGVHTAFEGGVPAKKIKDRFQEEISEKLLKIRWWDWNPETLAARADELADVGQFVEKYERKEK